ncbi:hypothetical protein BT69DRAFT_1144678 [Atractiella rhizophila]|nr:hypothetical protein BT69DRAFT_1144678 [Atractiella rhizophila]
MPKEDAQPDESGASTSNIPSLTVPKKRHNESQRFHPFPKRRRLDTSHDEIGPTTFIIHVKKQSPVQKDLDSNLVFKTFQVYGQILEFKALDPSNYQVTWALRGDAVRAREQLNNRGTKNCTFDITWDNSALTSHAPTSESSLGKSRTSSTLHLNSYHREGRRSTFYDSNRSSARLPWPPNLSSVSRNLPHDEALGQQGPATIDDDIVALMVADARVTLLRQKRKF